MRCPPRKELTMTPILKPLTRVATAAVLAFTMGCGAAEEADTAEEGAAVGSISQESGIAYTITGWPSAFPVAAGAPAANVLIPVSSGSNIQVNVSVAANGNVTFINFRYATFLASVPNRTFIKSSNPVTKSFSQNIGISYDINVAIEWIGSTITIKISSPAVPGGTIKAASTTLCSGA
jgi:hypothetical protein